MTVTADSKKRIVLPDAAPGDVFACEKKGSDLILTRLYRRPKTKKVTKAGVIKAIKNWKSVPNIKWEELRKVTREP